MDNLFKSEFNPETKIWSGLKRPFPYNKDTSVGSILHSLLPMNPENIAQINDTEQITLTSADLWQLSVRAALSFKEMNLAKDDIIGVMAPNTSYLTPVVYGAIFEGQPVQAVDPKFDTKTVVHLWNKTRPKIIFCDGSLIKIVQEVCAVLKLNSAIYTLNSHVDGVKQVYTILKERPNYQEKLYKPAEIPDGNHTLCILCSSGSSGLPKACPLSHRIFVDNFGLDPSITKNVLLTFSTLYWFSAFWDILNCGFTGDTHIIINNQFEPGQALHLIYKYKVTRVMLAPRNIALILNHSDIERKSLRSLDILTCGGARLPTEIRSRIRKYLKEQCNILVAYALTEKGPIAAFHTDEKPESTGKLLPNVEAKIVDPIGNCLGVDKEGEIVVRNNIPWKGYFDNKEATDEVYDSVSDWYKTGDSGYFDNDGYLYIVDRIKEIMKVKGYHVSPSAIEEVILQLPEISEVSVVGIPDLYSMHLPAALVIKTANSIITEEVIVSHVASKMITYNELTGGVFFVDDLPRTQSGKIALKVVKEFGQSLYKARHNLN